MLYNHGLVFLDKHLDFILTGGYKVLLTIVILIIARIISRVIVRSISKINDNMEQFDETLLPMVKSILSIVVYIIAGISILDIFGVNTSSVIALLGAASLTVGLVLKDTLSNVAAGIVLLVLRPFRVGHYIECGNVNGIVKKIGMFTTILETADGLYISAPNSSLWGAPIKNFTMNGKRRMDISVDISYEDSIDQGFNVLDKIIKEEPRFLQEPPPQVMLFSLMDSSVRLQIRAWAKTEDYWELYWLMNKKIKEEIEKAGLNIPFPQMDLHLKKEG